MYCKWTENWKSFDKFGETLMPIMAALGADPGEPQIVEIHNVITGWRRMNAHVASEMWPAA